MPFPPVQNDTSTQAVCIGQCACITHREPKAASSPGGRKPGLQVSKLRKGEGLGGVESWGRQSLFWERGLDCRACAVGAGWDAGEGRGGQRGHSARGSAGRAGQGDQSVFVEGEAWTAGCQLWQRL